MALRFATAFLSGLTEDYFVYNHDVKVGIPGGRKYYYPNVVATLEPEGEGVAEYIVYCPMVVVEIISPRTKANDYSMKLRDYTLIPELQYYLIAEPDMMLVTVYERNGAEWRGMERNGLPISTRSAKRLFCCRSWSCNCLWRNCMLSLGL